MLDEVKTWQASHLERAQSCRRRFKDHLPGYDSRDQAGLALDAFCQTWDDKYPTIGKAWHRDWDQLTPFFEYPDDIRKVIYTTNAIESINRSFRKILKNRGAFPTEQAVFKLMYLALQNIAKKWTMPIRNWKAALNRFAIMFEGRLP